MPVLLEEFPAIVFRSKSNVKNVNESFTEISALFLDL